MLKVFWKNKINNYNSIIKIIRNEKILVIILTKSIKNIYLINQFKLLKQIINKN